jgi:ABC-type antimicrobial peptide transport system permease subunit
MPTLRTGILRERRHVSRLPSLRSALRGLDTRLGAPDYLGNYRSVGGVNRFRTTLFGGLAGLALILAVVGLYGVAGFAVAQRTVEIGVRMALGASGGQVVAMVVRETLWLAATGAGLGVVAAWIGARSLSALLYGVTATRCRSCSRQEP